MLFFTVGSCFKLSGRLILDRVDWRGLRKKRACKAAYYVCSEHLIPGKSSTIIRFASPLGSKNSTVLRNLGPDQMSMKTSYILEYSNAGC